MTCPADLHTHTTASDGQYTPSQLAAKALAAGIQILAVTDHDTMDGAEEAVRAGQACGLTVLRGVELGAREDRHMHILGLNLGPECPALAELCRRLRASREERKYRIAAFLRGKGLDVPLEEVEALAGGGVVARPHFARVMLRCWDVSSLWKTFDRYLDKDEYQRIERWKAGAPECIAAIHDAGGKAVLAHPCQLGCSHGRLEEILRALKDAGLDGIECFYPRHSPEQTAAYLRLADKYGLHITGGSDFHGEAVRPDTFLTPIPLNLDWLGTFQNAQPHRNKLDQSQIPHFR